LPHWLLPGDVEYVFAAQSRHESAVAAPRLKPYEPAGHSFSHKVWPGLSVHLPKSQRRHSASGLPRGAYAPAAHGILSDAPGQAKPPLSGHGLHAAAPPSEYVFGGHGKAVAFVEFSGQR
jgi:hypothetical protein